jgi:hypothetical protein
MGRNVKKLSITASVKDEASGKITKLSGEVRKAAEAQAMAEGKLVKLHRESNAAMKAALSPTQKVTAAIRAQTAAGNPLAVKLASLQTQHTKLTAALKAEAKSGKALSASMVKQAAATQKSIAQTKAKIRAETRAAKATRAMAKESRFASLATSAYGFAAGVSAISIARLITRSVAAADAVGKTARKLGVAAEELQVYRKLADDAGIGTSKLENGLRSLTRRAAEAATGNAAFAKGFKQLGVNVTDAQGRLKPISELLPEMAEGFKNMSDGGMRVSVAMRTMGIGGAEMLPMLVGGAEAMEEATKKAHALGGVLDDDVIDAAENAAQALGDLQFAFGGLASSKAVTDLVTTLADAATDVVTFTTELLRGVDLVAEATRTAKAALAGLPGVGQIATAAMIASDAYSELGETVEDVSTGMVKVEKEMSREAVREHARAASLKAAAERVAARESERLAKERARNIAEANKKARAEEIEAEREFARAIQKIYDDHEAELELERKMRIDARFRDVLGEYQDQEELVREFNATVTEIEEDAAKDRKAIRDMLAQDERERIQENQALLEAGMSAFVAVSDEMFDSLADGSKTLAEASKTAMGSILAIALDSARDQIIAAASVAAANAFAKHQILPGVGLITGAAAASVAFGMASAYAQKFETGGIVQGGVEGKDSVLTLSMPGEEFIRASTARKFRNETGQTIQQALESGRGLGGTTIIQQQPVQHSLSVNAVLPTGRRQIREIAKMVNRELMSARAKGVAV